MREQVQDLVLARREVRVRLGGAGLFAVRDDAEHADDPCSVVERARS